MIPIMKPLTQAFCFWAVAIYMCVGFMRSLVIPGLVQNVNKLFQSKYFILIYKMLLKARQIIPHNERYKITWLI